MKILESVRIKRRTQSRKFSVPILGIALATSLGVVVLAVGVLAAQSSRTSDDPAASGPSRLSLAPAGTAPIDLRPGASLLFYGDAITAGLVASNPALSFRSRIEEEVDTRNVITIAEQNLRTWSFVEAHPIAPSGIDLAIVQVGTSDVAYTDPEIFRSSYARVLRSIRTANPTAGLMCLGPWTADDRALRIIEAMHEECLAVDGRFLTLSDLYQEQANRLSTGTGGQEHNDASYLPNETGHDAIAQRILSRIRLSDNSGLIEETSTR